MRRRRRFGRNFVPAMKEYIKNIEFFYILSITYLEILFKFLIIGNITFKDIFITIMFSAPVALVLSIVTRLFLDKINRVVLILINLFLFIMFSAQFIYYNVYSNVFSVYSMGEGGQVLQFSGEIFKRIKSNFVFIVLFFMPFVILIYLLCKKSSKFNRKTFKGYAIELSAGIFIFSIGMLSVLLGSRGQDSPYELYFKKQSPIFMTKEFGVLTYMRVDFKRLVLGFESELELSVEDVFNDETLEVGSMIDEDNSLAEGGMVEQPIEYDYNVLDIDFNTLINEETNETVLKLHKYFSTQNGTKKNEYTGKFKGKNLIMVLAEGFSPTVVDPILTPTLYKLCNEGMKFNNFYTPLFPVSTSDGEYMFCTGLIPKEGLWSMYESGNRYMPFVMGNLASANGYTARAYHNHDYTYYGRDVSHPNMGYEYVGVGNGLENKIQSDIWPESDLEMIEGTYSDFIRADENPFLTYYITVSGHLLYSFSGNMMAYKNRDLVKEVNYSESIKAYYACNIELDKALNRLIEELEKVGIAEDTVIALAADHYPYGLTLDEINEVQEPDVDENFDIHKNNFILWHKDIESIEIDKPCSSIDILPTLCNLFGFDYDSRLMIGKDIFSTKSGMVIFSNRSWITEKGRYNSLTGTFLPVEGVYIEDGYVESINKYVQNTFSISASIFDTDYYRRVIK